MMPPPAGSTVFPSRRSSDLEEQVEILRQRQIDHGLGRMLATLARDLGDRAVRTFHRVEADRKSTRLNSSHMSSSYAVSSLKKKNFHVLPFSGNRNRPM